jgi:hypothetical protein
MSNRKDDDASPTQEVIVVILLLFMFALMPVFGDIVVTKIINNFNPSECDHRQDFC